LILLGLLFVIYRQASYVLVLLSSLIVTLGLTCLCVYVLGITLHLYSLAGLTLSFGLVLDNAIMMLAHLRKYQNTKVVRALLGATLCTVVAISLIFGLPEEERMNLTDFAVVVILNLLMSFITAVWFTPAVFSTLSQSPLTPEGGTNIAEKLPFRGLGGFYTRFILFLRRFRWALYVWLVLAFGLPVFALPTKIEGWEWYNNTLGNEWYVENVRPTMDKWLGGALRLFVQEVYEKGGYREAQKTQLFVQIYMPQGTTLDHINRIAQETETIIAESEGLAKYVTNVYSEQVAFISVTFSAKGEASSIPNQLKQTLVAQSIDKAGADWNVYGVGEGFSSGGGDKIPSFKVEMRGYNYLELERQASMLAKKLMTHKRIQTVNTNERVDYSEKASKEWVLSAYPHTKQTAYLNNALIVNSLQNYTEVTHPQMQLFLENQIFPVLVQSRQATDFNLQSLWLNNITTPQATFRVADFGRIDTVKTTNALHRENRQYIRMVGFEYFGSSKFGEEFLEKTLAEMRPNMPVGYEAKKISYQFGQWDKVQRQYGLVVLLCVAIFILCSILFESVVKPFWIILNVPIALIGLFLTFAWGGFYFDQGGYAAFFLLGGLVVNASIYIVNDYNTLPAQDALEAVRHKALPIVLTMFSNIMGLVPFLSEGDSEVFWFSLAVGTIGGLVFSLLAIFVVLPVLMIKAPKK
jgi:multidrug efflux pump subunit AcrB